MSIVTLLSAKEAARLTERIKLTAGSIRDNLFKLRNLLDEARNSNAWQVLGFASWTAYLAETLAEQPMRVSREERQELVGYLAGEGLSSRAIAPIVGVTDRQVRNDMAGGNYFPPAGSSGSELPDAGEEVAGSVEPPPHAPDPATVDLTTGEVLDDTVTVTEHTLTEKTRTVTGLDGKTYTAPTSRKPARAPLPKQFFNAVYDLGKAVDRIARLIDDDRFPTNKGQLSDLHAADLARSASTLARVLEAIN